MTDAAANAMTADAGAPAGAQAETSTRMARVWDLFVRAFHWSLVLSFAVAWVTAEDWSLLHYWAGYAAGGLIGLRLIWGLIGTRYARFAQFVRSPREVIAYLRDMAAGRERRYVGHNPAGGAMILALLVTMIATSVTGWMSTLDRFWGRAWVEEGHEAVATLMLVLVLLHIGGVIVASLRHRENLPKAMWTGFKRAPSGDDVA
jgi:cytochrome b